MKKLITAVLIVMVSGCGNPGTVAMIAGAGAGASHTLLGINKDLEEALVAKNMELQEALESIESATTEAEKLVAEAKAKALASQIESITDVRTGAALVEEGIKTDWTDPNAVAGYGGMTIMALIAWLYRKKGIKYETKYDAHKAGVNKFMVNNTDKAPELYDDIGEVRRYTGVT